MYKNIVKILATGAVAALAFTACSSAAGDSDTTESSDSTSNAAVHEEAAALVPDDIREQGTITAVTSANPPNMIANAEQTEFTGLWADVGEELANRLDLEIEYTVAKFDAIITGLEADRYDLALADMNDTPERQERVDFVDFFTAGDTVVVAADSPLADITELTDLCGKVVSAQAGSAPVETAEAANEECVEQGKPEMTIQTFPDNQANVLALTAGRVDAMLNNTNQAIYLLQQQPDKFAQTDVYYNESVIGMVFAKDDSELRDAAQVALQSMMDDGTYLEILEAHGQETRAIDEATINAGG